jgi:hypothetical protein
MPSAGLLIPEIPEGGGCSKGAQPKKVFIESTGVYSTGTVQVQYIDKCYASLSVVRLGRG